MLRVRQVTMGMQMLIVCMIFWQPRAYAYLDPGTGSYLIQVLLGIGLGAAFSVKVFWGKIKAFFNRCFRKDTPTHKE